MLELRNNCIALNICHGQSTNLQLQNKFVRDIIAELMSSKWIFVTVKYSML